MDPVDDRVELREYYFADTDEWLPYAVFVSSKVSKDKKAPLVLALHGFSGNHGTFMRTPCVSRSYVLYLNDGQEEAFEYGYREMGYECEAEEVTSCLQRDMTESNLLPLEFSLRLIRVLNRIRKKCGSAYQADGLVFA